MRRRAEIRLIAGAQIPLERLFQYNVARQLSSSEGRRRGLQQSSAVLEVLNANVQAVLIAHHLKHIVKRPKAVPQHLSSILQKNADICTFEMVERAPGRWTLTATCSPVERSLALYTCRADT